MQHFLPHSSWLTAVVVAAVAAGSWLLAAALGGVLGRLARRSAVLADLATRARNPFRFLAVLIASTVVVEAAPGAADWRGPVVRALGLFTIAAVGWLLAVGAFVVEDIALTRYDVDVVDNRHARRVRTQVSLLRRLTVVVITVLAAAAMLLTVPGARAAGASLLASAGVISVVAGLAAQTSLANVFAGLQLAFTDAMRVDDVVVVDDEWGRIEEITLTYVVVHVWDDRRLVLPSTYFTTKPFENWTRKESAVLGAVELDVDWSTPFDGMRAELDRLLADSTLWDHRVGVLQVTDAVGTLVRVRVLLSAADAGTLFDLRCRVREALVVWLQDQHAYALPRIRTEPTSGSAPSAPRSELPSGDAAGLFTGSSEGRERSRAFTGPSDEEQAGRDLEAAAAR